MWTQPDRLEKARKEAGLSQAELAERIDVARSTVSNYESATYRKRRKDIVLRAWAAACEVPFEWLRDDLDLREHASGWTGDRELVAA